MAWIEVLHAVVSSLHLCVILQLRSSDSSDECGYMGHRSANHSWPDSEDQPGLDSEWSDDEVIELEVLTAGNTMSTMQSELSINVISCI